MQSHNSQGIYPVDVARVGDPDDLPLGKSDPELLLWAEREKRILVTQDRDTMPSHLGDHLLAGRMSPGVFIIRHQATIMEIVTFLRDAAHASGPDEWENVVAFIP
jgi:hypothetical protein